jgi:capsular exopolysaccharide synthesis family protein
MSLSRIEEAMQKKARSDSRTEDEGDGRAAIAYPEAPEAPSPAVAHPETTGAVDEHIVSFHYPRSGLTENFKQIQLVVRNMLPEGTNRILMFTSSFAGEGKTTASLNLAAAIAQDPSKRVIVVDADMREPKVHTQLGMRLQRGFGDLLVSDAPASTVTVNTPIPGLKAILCGELPPNPAELVASERAREIFAEIKPQYDYVIVDTPPVLPVVDTIHMAAFADGVLLIVEAARTSRRKVQRAVQLLNDAHASVLGFLLNKSPIGATEYQTDRYYYRSSRYGRS